MKSSSLSRRAVPRQRLLLSAIALFSTGLIMTVPAAALSQAGAAESSDLKLVALGDSYTAGEGGDGLPLTEQSLNTGCNRSNNAYPFVAGDILDMETESFACSGARTDAFTRSFSNEAAQVNNIGDADVVAFTIGGNDARIIQTATGEGFSAFQTALAQLPGKLDTVYAQVKDKAPNAEVYALTYTNIFPSDDATIQDCFPGNLKNITAAQINQAFTQLNTVVKNQAKAAGFHVVDVQNALRGHDICSDQPFASGFDAQVGALHPNGAGHAAVGKLLASAIEDTLPALNEETTTTTTTKPTSTSTSTTSTTKPTSTTSTTAATSTTTSTTAKPNGNNCRCSSTTTSTPVTLPTSTTSTTVRKPVSGIAVPVIPLTPVTAAEQTTTTTTSPATTTSTTAAPATTTTTAKPTTTTKKPKKKETTTTSTTVVAASNSSTEDTVLGDAGEAGGDSEETTTTTIDPEVAPTPTFTTNNDSGGSPESGGNQLAFTGAKVANLMSIGGILLGTGFGLTWLRFYLRDRRRITY